MNSLLALNVVLMMTASDLGSFRELVEDHSVVKSFIFNHETLKRDDQEWTHSVILLVKDREAVVSLKNKIIENKKLTEHVKALDVMKIQKNIDMIDAKFDPSEKEFEMAQWIEYVFTKQEHKEEYYRQQYEFSGPAMRRLWEKDRCGRFVGFEIQERLYQKDSSFPTWDVIHVVGFTWWQLLKSIPFFLPAWNKQARETFGDSKTRDQIWNEDWPKFRTKLKTRIMQLRVNNK